MDCVICLKNIEDEDKYKLSCNHDYFHKECIEKWLAIKSTCPLCRENVIQNPYILIWNENMRIAAETYKIYNNLPHEIKVISNLDSRSSNDIVYNFS